MVRLPQADVHRIIDRHAAQDWFKIGFDRRDVYWNCWAPSFWLASKLSSRDRILETGCGCGLNLLWFAQQGFRRLYGFDNDPKAISAAVDLSRLARAQITYWEDDALSPAKMPAERFQCILALNWTYLLTDFSINTFAQLYGGHLVAGGYLVLDVVDPCYQRDPRHLYCTQDWDRPEAERRPSEYPTRYALPELLGPMEYAGLRHVQTIAYPQHVPKVVHIFQSN
jgi:SAM-dependent methyltransferase